MQRWAGEPCTAAGTAVPVAAHELPLARSCSWSSVESYSAAPEAGAAGSQHGVAPLAPGGRPVPPTRLLLKQHQQHQQQLYHQHRQQSGSSWPRLQLKNVQPQASSHASSSRSSPVLARAAESPLCSPKAVPICSGVVGNAIFSRQLPPWHNADGQQAESMTAAAVLPASKVGWCCQSSMRALLNVLDVAHYHMTLCRICRTQNSVRGWHPCTWPPGLRPAVQAVLLQ